MRGRQLDLDRLMARLYAEDPAQPDAVSLMTIHGAKGLEFDHVFVVGVGLRGRGDDPRLLNWLEMPREQGGDHLVMAPIRFRGDDDEASDDAINLYLKAVASRTRTRGTRAPGVCRADSREALAAPVRASARPRAAMASSISLPRRIRCCTTSGLPSARDVEAFEVVGARHGSSRRNRSPSRRRPAGACNAGPRRSRRRPDVLARGELPPTAIEQDEIEFSWARQTARRVGTVVHEALERFGRGQLPAPADLPRMRARLESRLQALGIEPERAQAGADRALTALRATLEDPKGRWLFDPTPIPKRIPSSRCRACAARRSSTW